MTSEVFIKTGKAILRNAQIWKASIPDVYSSLCSVAIIVKLQLGHDSLQQHLSSHAILTPTSLLINTWQF